MVVIIRYIMASKAAQLALRRFEQSGIRQLEQTGTRAFATGALAAVGQGFGGPGGILQKNPKAAAAHAAAAAAQTGMKLSTIPGIHIPGAQGTTGSLSPQDAVMIYQQRLESGIKPGGLFNTLIKQPTGSHSGFGTTEPLINAPPKSMNPKRAKLKKQLEEHYGRPLTDKEFVVESKKLILLAEAQKEAAKAALNAETVRIEAQREINRSAAEEAEAEAARNNALAKAAKEEAEAEAAAARAAEAEAEVARLKQEEAALEAQAKRNIEEKAALEESAVLAARELAITRNAAAEKAAANAAAISEARAAAENAKANAAIAKENALRQKALTNAQAASIVKEAQEKARINVVDAIENTLRQKALTNAQAASLAREAKEAEMTALNMRALEAKVKPIKKSNFVFMNNVANQALRVNPDPPFSSLTKFDNSKLLEQLGVHALGKTVKSLANNNSGQNETNRGALTLAAIPLAFFMSSEDAKNESQRKSSVGAAGSRRPRVPLTADVLQNHALIKVTSLHMDSAAANGTGGKCVDGSSNRCLTKLLELMTTFSEGGNMDFINLQDSAQTDQMMRIPSMAANYRSIQHVHNNVQLTTFYHTKYVPMTQQPTITGFTKAGPNGKPILISFFNGDLCIINAIMNKGDDFNKIVSSMINAIREKGDKTEIIRRLKNFKIIFGADFGNNLSLDNKKYKNGLYKGLISLESIFSGIHNSNTCCSENFYESAGRYNPLRTTTDYVLSSHGSVASYVGTIAAGERPFTEHLPVIALINFDGPRATFPVAAAAPPPVVTGLVPNATAAAAAGTGLLPGSTVGKPTGPKPDKTRRNKPAGPKPTPTPAPVVIPAPVVTPTPVLPPLPNSNNNSNSSSVSRLSGVNLSKNRLALPIPGPVTTTAATTATTATPFVNVSLNSSNNEETRRGRARPISPKGLITTANLTLPKAPAGAYRSAIGVPVRSPSPGLTLRIPTIITGSTTGGPVPPTTTINLSQQSTLGSGAFRAAIGVPITATPTTGGPAAPVVTLSNEERVKQEEIDRIVRLISGRKDMQFLYLISDSISCRDLSKLFVGTTKDLNIQRAITEGPDPSLSGLGIEIALATREKYKDLKFNHILIPPVFKSIQTAVLLFGTVGMIKEMFPYIVAEPVKRTGAAPKMTLIHAAYNTTKEVTGFMKLLQRSSPKDPSFIPMSEATLRSMIPTSVLVNINTNYITGTPTKYDYNTLIQNIQRIVIDSVNRAEYGDGQFALIAHSDIIRDINENHLMPKDQETLINPNRPYACELWETAFNLNERVPEMILKGINPSVRPINAGSLVERDWARYGSRCVWTYKPKLYTSTRKGGRRYIGKSKYRMTRRRS